MAQLFPYASGNGVSGCVQDGIDLGDRIKYAPTPVAFKGHFVRGECSADSVQESAVETFRYRKFPGAYGASWDLDVYRAFPLNV